MRWGVLEQTFLTKLKIGTLEHWNIPYKSTTCSEHYRNITRQNRNITTQAWFCSRGAKDSVCAWANALKQR